MMNFSEVIFELLRIKGMEVFNDRCLFSSCLESMSQGEFSKEKRFISKCFTDTILALFIDLIGESDNTKEAAIGSIALTLMEESFVSEDYARFVVKQIIDGIRLYEKKQSENHESLPCLLNDTPTKRQSSEMSNSTLTEHRIKSKNLSDKDESDILDDLQSLNISHQAINDSDAILVVNDIDQDRIGEIPGYLELLTGIPSKDYIQYFRNESLQIQGDKIILGILKRWIEIYKNASVSDLVPVENFRDKTNFQSLDLNKIKVSTVRILDCKDERAAVQALKETQQLNDFDAKQKIISMSRPASSIQRIGISEALSVIDSLESAGCVCSLEMGCLGLVYRTDGRSCPAESIRQEPARQLVDKSRSAGVSRDASNTPPQKSARQLVDLGFVGKLRHVGVDQDALNSLSSPLADRLVDGAEKSFSSGLKGSFTRKSPDEPVNSDNGDAVFVCAIDQDKSSNLFAFLAALISRKLTAFKHLDNGLPLAIRCNEQLTALFLRALFMGHSLTKDSVRLLDNSSLREYSRVVIVLESIIEPTYSVVIRVAQEIKNVTGLEITKAKGLVYDAPVELPGVHESKVAEKIKEAGGVVSLKSFNELNIDAYKTSSIKILSCSDKDATVHVLKQVFSDEMKAHRIIDNIPCPVTPIPSFCISDALTVYSDLCAAGCFCSLTLGILKFME